MLQSLSLGGHFSIGCLQVMSVCRSLRALDIEFLSQPIDQDSFNVLSSLPQLSYLRINPPATGIQYSPHSATHPFAVLETLRIVGGNFSSITGLVAFIRSTRLHTIVLLTSSTCELNVWRHFIETLASAPRYQRSLRTFNSSVDLSTPQTRLSAMSWVVPLQELAALEDFRLYPSNGTKHCQSLEDGDVMLLASGWPKITRLYTTSGSTPRATFRSLHAIAHHCPRLAYLRLDLDLTNLPPVHSIPILSHRLTKIDLRNSTIGNLGNRIRLVCLLDRIFPRLLFIHSLNMRDGLPTLNELRKLCQEVGKHARTRVRLAQEIESRTLATVILTSTLDVYPNVTC
jgi:hypothetical protein